LEALSRVVMPLLGGTANARLRQAVFAKGPLDLLDPLPRAFAEAVREERLVARGDRILVAVSGGADSTALLLLVSALRPDISVVVGHLDHGLRPDSASDARFVSQMACRLGLDCIRERVEVAPEPKGSLETRAREVRYAFLDRAAQSAGATRVALGHQLDDHVETVLFRLLRGTGIRGLRGIPVRRSLAPGSRAEVVRPLLGVPREAILSHLRALGVTYREDSTNCDSDACVRNKLRKEFLPDLEHRSPGVRDRLRRLSETAVAVEKSIEAAAEVVKRDAEVRPGVFRSDLFRRVVPAVMHEVLSPFKPTSSEIAVLASRLEVEPIRSSTLELSSGATVAIGPDHVVVSTVPPAFPGRLHMEPFPLEKLPDFLRSKGPFEEVIDAERVDLAELRWRSREPGDRMRPLGSPGTRKVKTILIDDGVPRSERDRWPLVVDAARGIVWLVGLRLAHAVRVVPGETRRAVRLVWET